MKLLILSRYNKLYIIILLSIILAACRGRAATDYKTNSAASPTPPISSSNPTISISADATQIAYGNSTNIRWISNDSTSCASSPSGLNGTTGVYTTPKLTSTTTYTMTCVGTNGLSVTGKVTIIIAPSVITSFANAGGGNTTVTSNNDLSNGAIITINGTTNYNGTYTVASVTPANFKIVKTFTANDATGYWQVAGGMISGCSTTGAVGNIKLDIAPGRFNGVAPLSVFFDATGTVSTISPPATNSPFHDFEYRWSFGDDTAGSLNLSPPVVGTATWNMGSNPGVNKRNVATGPVATHVYETPGTYTVALSVTDGTNTVTNSCAQIVVQEPAAVFAGTNTICFAASTTPQAGVDGCPAGAEVHKQPAFDTAVNTYNATGKRLLFKHDDVFTGTANATITATGPGTIGMYGTGAKPIIHTTGAFSTLVVSNGAITNLSDWRVMDLEFDGLAHPTSGGVTAGGIADQITFLRLDIHNTVFGWNIAGDGLEYAATHDHFITPHEFDQWTIADCNTYDTDSSGASGVMGMYAFGHRFAILGSRIYHVISGEHAVRIEHAAKAVFSNNTFGDPAPTKQVFSLRAPSFTDVGAGEYLPNLLPGTMAYTTQVVVSDNHFIAGRSGQPVDNKPSAIQYNAHFSDIIFERNWYTVGTSTVCCGPMLGIRSQNVTVRNELFDLTGAVTHSVIGIDGATAAGPASSEVRLYNNTAFSNDAADIFMVRQYAGTANITIQNNFVYAPNAVTGSNGPPAFYDVAGGTPALASNNTSDSQITSSTALMTTVPPTTPAGFKLQPGSYAYANGAGTLVPVWSDFTMAPLTSTSPRAMGAFIP